MILPISYPSVKKIHNKITVSISDDFGLVNQVEGVVVLLNWRLLGGLVYGYVSVNHINKNTSIYVLHDEETTTLSVASNPKWFIGHFR